MGKVLSESSIMAENTGLTRWERKQAFHAADAACPLLECLESRVLLSDGALPVASEAARAIAASSAAIFSKNRSTSTLCAEEDNVNVPLAVIKGRHHVSFTIEASHPKYVIGEDHHDADFTTCPP